MPRARRPANPGANVVQIRPPTAASVPTGLPYGEHQDLTNQIAQSPTAPAAPSADLMASARAYVAPPVSQVGLFRPTQRPGEHVMTGAPAGPGAGPEALGVNLAPAQPTDLRGLLARLAPSSPAVAALADYVNSGRA